MQGMRFALAPTVARSRGNPAIQPQAPDSTATNSSPERSEDVGFAHRRSKAGFQKVKIAALVGLQDVP